MKMKPIDAVRVKIKPGFIHWMHGTKYLGGEEIEVPRKDYEADQWKFQPVEISEGKKGNPERTKDKKVSDGKNNLRDKAVV